MVDIRRLRIAGLASFVAMGLLATGSVSEPAFAGPVKKRATQGAVVGGVAGALIGKNR